MNDKYNREVERLKSFDTWPLQFLDKHILARTGVFYTGDGDKVKCYFCEVEIGRWETDDHPVSEHLRWSPNCPLLRRRTTNNVPINAEALNQLLPAISYDICGANDDIEVRPHSYAEGNITSAALNATTPALDSIASCSNGCNYYPEYPEYAIESARLRSFAEWARCLKQKPEQLAEAGFFYTGIGDRVKCFSCGGGLKDWEENDEPWEQHALWLSKCRFLKLIKGEQFIEDIKAKYKEADACSTSSGSSFEGLEYEATTTAGTTTNANPALLSDSLAQTEAPQVCASSKAVAPSDTLMAARTSTSTVNSGSSSSSSCSIPEEKMCKICYASEYNTAFLPCGHVVACAKCASSVTKCPLCRKPFTEVMRVYFS